MGKVWRVFKSFILYPTLIILAPIVVIFMLALLAEAWTYVTATPEKAANVARGALIDYAIDEGFPSSDYGEPQLICRDDDLRDYVFQFKHHQKDRILEVHVLFGLRGAVSIGEVNNTSRCQPR